ncbi:MAG: hypothetical protein AB7V04_06465 [Desulfomonilaceae bacterium]
MPYQAQNSKAEYRRKRSNKYPQDNLDQGSHPSGMTNFEAVALIQKQQGVTDTTKRLWIHCLNGAWSRDYVFLSKKYTPVALDMSWKTIVEAKRFLWLHRLIEVDKSTKTHAIRCNERIKWLAQLPEGIIWKDVRTGADIEVEIQAHLEKRGMLDGCKIYTQKEEQKENIKKQGTATSLIDKKKIISKQLNEILHNLRELGPEFDGINVWAEFDLFKQSLPKPWQIPDSVEINLEADWIRHLKRKKKDVDGFDRNGRFKILAEIEDGLLSCHEEGYFETVPVNVPKVFQGFKSWLLETSEGKAVKNGDIHNQWGHRLSQAIQTAKASPEKKAIDIFG